MRFLLLSLLSILTISTAYSARNTEEARASLPKYLSPEEIDQYSRHISTLLDSSDFRSWNRYRTLTQPKYFDDLTPKARGALFRWILEADIYTPEAIIDALLGMDVVGSSIHIRVREEISPRFPGEEIWDWGTTMPQTSYELFHRIFSHIPLQPRQLVVDIGAGYGRLGFYLAIFHPGVKFIGYEIVPERVKQSQRAATLLGLPDHIEFRLQDLAAPDFSLEPADIYYSWNPVNEPTGKLVGKQLLQIGDTLDYKWIVRSDFHGMGETCWELFHAQGLNGEIVIRRPRKKQKPL